MAGNIVCRRKIIRSLEELSILFPDIPMGRLIIEALQPEKPIRELKALEDDWFEVCLEAMLSAKRRRGEYMRRHR